MLKKNKEKKKKTINQFRKKKEPLGLVFWMLRSDQTEILLNPLIFVL